MMKVYILIGVHLWLASCSQEEALESVEVIDITTLYQHYYINYDNQKELYYETCFSPDNSSSFHGLSSSYEVQLNGESLEVTVEDLRFCKRAGYSYSSQPSSFLTFSNDVLDSSSSSVGGASYDFQINKISPGAIFSGVDFVFSVGLGEFTDILSAEISVSDQDGAQLFTENITFDESTGIASINVPSSVFDSREGDFTFTTRAGYRHLLSTSFQGATLNVDVVDSFTVSKQ